MHPENLLKGLNLNRKYDFATKWSVINKNNEKKENSYHLTYALEPLDLANS